jgi:hypothetical protein
MTVADLWYLTGYLVGLPEMWERKIAVLPPAEEFDRAAFFALAAENRGGRVRAFASLEEAIGWLAEGRAETPR